MRLACSFALITSGCASVERTHVTTFPSDDVGLVFGDTDRGAIGWLSDGPRSDEIDVAVRLWATGSSRSGAERRMESSEWGVRVVDGVLDLWGRSPDPRAGVDLVAVGPSRVDVDLLTLDGVAEAHDVEGSVILTGSSVFATGLHGPVDVLGTAGNVEVEAFPSDADAVTIEGRGGDVTLALPYGLPVDLRVVVDPGWGYTITDLGFEAVERSPGRFSAVSGAGTLKVDVLVTDGSFWLYEAIEPADSDARAARP